MDFSDCNCLEDIALKQELLQMTSVVHNDEKIYHYTSIDGLNGILRDENIVLRFTRADCLNDYTEGKNIIDYYKNVLTKLLEFKLIDKSFYNKIIDIGPYTDKPFIFEMSPPQYYDGMLVKAERVSKYITYLFCMSRENDSLPMWNYYSKKNKADGFNIGFSGKKVRELFQCPGMHNGFNSELIVVEYDEIEKNDILLDYIVALYKYREHDDIDFSKIKTILTGELTKWQYAYKLTHFSHEREIRIAIHVPIDFDLPTTNNEEISLVGPPPEEESKHIYVSVVNKTIVKEITCSPLISQEEREQLQSEVKLKGYEGNMKTSRIPIRF